MTAIRQRSHHSSALIPAPRSFAAGQRSHTGRRPRSTARSTPGSGRGGVALRRAARSLVVAIVAVHGLIHLMGVFKGFGWADVAALSEPIGTTAAVGWLAATISVLGAAALMAGSVPWWWKLGAPAAVISQAMLVTSWSDAGAGTMANLVLAGAAVHGFLAEGPHSLRAAYRRLAAERWPDPITAAAATDRSPVTDADLAHLPRPVAAYVRASGAVGQPRVRGFRAGIHGRIRGGPDQPWMPFTGEQVNTYHPEPGRIFSMDATMGGLPVDVLHAFIGPRATMRVRVAGLVTMVDTRGPELDRAETVTLLNDLCVMAPAALVDAPITWTGIDDRHTRATITIGDHTVSAELWFNAAGELVDFVSDDRLRASADGRTFTYQRWSTPIGGYRHFGPRRIGSVGHGRWHPRGMEGDFDYLEFMVDQITYDTSDAVDAA